MIDSACISQDRRKEADQFEISLRSIVYILPPLRILFGSGKLICSA